MAQTVYSVNAVGYVNLVIPNGFSIIANPLNAASNTIPALFPAVPANTAIYKFNPTSGAYDTFRYQLGQWNPAAAATTTLVPGEGAFINVPGATPLTNTFVGEVMSGNLTNTISQGFSIRSSQVPQAGKLATDLGYTPSANDAVYQFSNATGQYATHRFQLGQWTGGEPNVAVGEGFFMNVAAVRTWSRTFSIGN